MLSEKADALSSALGATMRRRESAPVLLWRCPLTSLVIMLIIIRRLGSLSLLNSVWWLSCGGIASRYGERRQAHGLCTQQGLRGFR